MRLKQRDIDAIRIGVEKQTRDKCAQEESQRIFDRIMAQERVQQVELQFAADLREGDRLVASDNGLGFHVHSTVRSAERVDDTRYVWIAQDYATGGSGGDRRVEDDLCLIERRDA